MNQPRRGLAELTIGIIGPHDVVQRIMLSQAPGTAPDLPGPDGPGVALRLVAAAYRDEREAADKVARLGSGVDVCLFASPVAYGYARRSGALAVPGTYVRLGGSALYSALARAGAGPGLARSSVDTLGRADVQDAFADLGVPLGGVHIREEPGSTAAAVSFHERLSRQGVTTMAFTCLPLAAARLADAGVPVTAVTPTGSAIRSALQAATLLGYRRRLEDTQLAVAVVEVPTLRDASRRSLPRQQREELRLTVHRFLVQEAQRIHAMVTPAAEAGFVVTATRGSLAAETDGFRVPPFAQRAQRELGVTVEVGVGLGQTATDAEARARAVLGRIRPAAAGRGFAIDVEGHAIVPAPREPPARPSARQRGPETLARLASGLSATGPGAAVVDAEAAARLLGVTPRTARRLLHVLVQEGLAWPLPPVRVPQPGRPRQYYRLVIEKLAGQRPDE